MKRLFKNIRRDDDEHVVVLHSLDRFMWKSIHNTLKRYMLATVQNVWEKIFSFQGLVWKIVSTAWTSLNQGTTSIPN